MLSNFRRSGVSLTFCKCIYDSKLTKICHKKITFGGQTLNHYRKSENHYHATIFVLSDIELTKFATKNLVVKIQTTIDDAAPFLRSNFPQTALVATLFVC
jgi:hypothetical protein